MILNGKAGKEKITSGQRLIAVLSATMGFTLEAEPLAMPASFSLAGIVFIVLCPGFPFYGLSG
ncbi:hypothetical protein [Propionispora hippei]|uniref:hypothetical protein n=1 Tax=Propionispora hippei TaxID=209080 RepID=UPI00122CE9A7|nr:hypothetical protein [Propionispora hippei]